MMVLHSDIMVIMSNKEYVNICTSIIDKIIPHRPELAKDRDILLGYAINDEEVKPKYVLEMFRLDGQKYYRDPFGSVISPDVKVVGSYKCTDGEYTYYFNNDD